MKRNFFERNYLKFKYCVFHNKFRFEKISSISLFLVGFLLLLFSFDSYTYNALSLYIWAIWLFVISTFHMFVTFSKGTSICKRIMLNFVSGIIWLYNSLLLFYEPFNLSVSELYTFFVVQLCFSVTSFFIFSFLFLNSNIKRLRRNKANGKLSHRSN